MIRISATGHGSLDLTQTAAVQVFVGNQPADVLYSGPAPGTPGLWQIDARVPAAAAGQLPLFLVAGNIPSNGVTVWVQ